MTSSSRFPARLLSRLALVLVSLLALPAAFAVSNGPGQRPDTGKVAPAAAFRLAPGTARLVDLRLGDADTAAIDAVKRANAAPDNKRLQIGIGRSLPAGAPAASTSLAWSAVADGAAAQWLVTSPGARALRVAVDALTLPAGAELRFAGEQGAGTVYGPFTVADLAPGEPLWWSPVLEGESALVEVFLPAGRGTAREAVTLAGVSHLFASPTDLAIDRLAKLGESQSCEVDLICRSSSDSALASVGKSVARMTFTVSSGGTALCTGTLLNPIGGSFTPYFYSAAHCFSTQSEASSLTTHWFYDRTACGAGGVSGSYTQLTGGATLLYANTTSDVLFLRLNQTPPSAAVYAGWDAATLSTGTALTAVHHPAGDVKKVSLGTMAGFTGYNGASGSNHIDVTWNSLSTGVTEVGSSGSGIFSFSGSGYQLRGGLHGGPSKCTATGSALRDYYSRFDQAYPSISQYLNPTSGGGGTTSEAMANGGFESGSSGWTQVSSFGAIITTDASVARSGSSYAWLGGYDSANDTLYQDVAIPAGATQATLQFWYRINTGESTTSTAYDTMTVAVVSPSSGTVLSTLATYSNLNASTGWVQSAAFDLTAFAGTTVRIRFNARTDSSAPTSFRVDDVSLQVTTGSGTSANYTGLWYNAPADSEPGWGINFTHQGSKLFATLFTYDVDGGQLWLVMSGGDLQADGRTFTGTLYRTTGPVFNASPFVWNPATDLSIAGTMTVSFSGNDSATLTYTYGGRTVTKNLVKQVYGTRAATCTSTTGSRASLTNYQDLWYNSPAESEAGWGVNITHQDNTIFATLFTYGASRRGMWLVMSGGTRQSDGTYFGTLYLTTGPAYYSSPWVWNPNANLSPVGTMRLAFSNGTTGTLTYTVNGATVVKNITRQVFSTTLPSCS